MYCIKCGKQTNNESSICDECAKSNEEQIVKDENIKNENISIEEPTPTETLVKEDIQQDNNNVGNQEEKPVEVIEEDSKKNKKKKKWFQKKDKTQVEKKPRERLSPMRSSIIGLSSGLIALLLSLVILPGYVFGVLGIVESFLGLIDTVRGPKKGKVFVLPLVLSITGLVISLIAFVWEVVYCILIICSILGIGAVGVAGIAGIIGILINYASI